MVISSILQQFGWKICHKLFNHAINQCVSGICICNFGKFGERKGAVENFSKSFPNGEHNPEKNESQLFPHGTLKSLDITSS